MAYDLCDICHLELTLLDCGCICCKDCDDIFICEKCNRCNSCIKNECDDCSLCTECHDKCPACSGCITANMSCENCSTCELCIDICLKCELCVNCTEKVCTRCKSCCSDCVEFPEGDFPSDRCLSCATRCVGCKRRNNIVCYGCNLCDDCIRGGEGEGGGGGRVMKCTVCRRYCKWCERHSEGHVDCLKFQFYMNELKIEEDHLKKIILSFII